MNTNQSKAVFCHNLPKAELHAHLTGCLSLTSVQQILSIDLPGRNTDTVDAHAEYEKIQKQQAMIQDIQYHNERTLHDCFQIFTILHDVLNSTQRMITATNHVLRDLAYDNVVYAELRTTPRPIPTKQVYLEAVLHTIEQWMSANPLTAAGYPMDVRLLVSIDRSQSLDSAIDTVNLAHEYMQKPNSVVVGIDFSGNPAVGNAKQFEAAFQLAQSLNIPTTVHTAEIVHASIDDENDFILRQARPKRLGHAVHISKEHWQYLSNSLIPVEICFTSNLLTGSCSHAAQHPVAQLLESKYPFALCSDDSGVFKCNLSQEYIKVATQFQLNSYQIEHIARAAFKYGFNQDRAQAVYNASWSLWQRTQHSYK